MMQPRFKNHSPQVSNDVDAHTANLKEKGYDPKYDY